MSAEPPKKRGFFGRLFGGDARPEADAPADPSGEALTDMPLTLEDVADPPPTDDRPDAEDATMDAATETADDTTVEAVVEIAVDTTIATPVPDNMPDDTPSPASEDPGETIRKTGWFGRLTGGLSRTTSQLTGSITGLFTKRKLDAEALEDLEDILIQADLGVDTAMAITESLAKDRYDKEIAPDEIRAVMAEEVARVLAPVAVALDVDRGHKPHVVLVVGVNGSGKTTTIGKLAARFKAGGKSVMLAAGDTFRAAAIEQLKIWGGRIDAPVIAREQGADAASLAFEAIDRALAEGTDVLMIDTAGRLQNKADLMAELEKVVRVIQKKLPDAPHDVVLVLDATVGQNALNQVEVFRQIAGVTGLVMTKLDGTARGGILVAIAAKHQLPVHAIGVGEGIDDLQPFEAEAFARAIAGLAD